MSELFNTRVFVELSTSSCRSQVNRTFSRIWVDAGLRGLPSARVSAGQRGSARVSAGQCVNQRHGCALPLPYLLCGDDGAVINGLRPGVFDGGGDAKRIEEEEMTI